MKTGPAEIRRLLVQALGRPNWRRDDLVEIATLAGPEAPEEAAGAMLQVRSAVRGASLDLRLCLMGAFACSGWGSEALARLAEIAVAAAPCPTAPEIDMLRAAAASKIIDLRRRREARRP